MRCRRSQYRRCSLLGEERRSVTFAHRPLAASRLAAVSSAERTVQDGEEFDAVIIGGGMGGLTTAAKLAEAGCSVAVLEKYIIPGGSAGHFERDGFIFDVGSSMMFGMGDEGTTNLITKALESVGKRIETVPDPTQIHYHLPKSSSHPKGLEVKVWRKYEEFLQEMYYKFPHEKEGIKRFYDDCWKVFNSLNSIELKSLEEPRYLMQQFFNQPISCLTLASFLGSNTGDVARKYIKDEELLNFIDIECYCWSTVLAKDTPTINAGMVFCDRHFGGINYPVGGVGRIPELMAQGIEERGGQVVYKANVKKILVEHGQAKGVQLADGRKIFGKAIISNATRWDTFENLLQDAPKEVAMPKSEASFREKYKKSPSFVSIHMAIREIDSISNKSGTECHHIIVEEWSKMMDPLGTIFVSIPSLLDPSLCPDGCHVFHTFSPDWIENWELKGEEYLRRKSEVADEFIRRLERIFPGLSDAVMFKEVGTPRTHRRFLNRIDGTYGPIPSRKPFGMVGMPFNTTDVTGLYCVGDSTFPGQGVNAVVFSGFGCAHRVLCDLGREPTWSTIDTVFNAGLKTARRAV